MILVAITGRPINKVKILPNSTESEGESSFCFLNNKVRAAKLIPDSIANILPVNPSRDKSSIKNNPSPIKRIIIAEEKLIKIA